MKHKARSKMIQQSIRRHRRICTIEEKVLCTETVSRGWLSIRKVGHTKTYSASHMYAETHCKNICLVVFFFSCSLVGFVSDATCMHDGHPHCQQPTVPSKF